MVASFLPAWALRRAGLTPEERHEIRACHRVLFRSGLHLPEAIERVAKMVRTDPGRRLLEFLRAPSKRGFMRLRRRAHHNDDCDGDSP